MKKFIIVCLILFIANVGCKKMNVDGGGICACSPVIGPELHLAVKNNAGEDLLNNKTAGAYSKDKIELYRKGSDGKVIPINFGILPPSTSGDETFNFYRLYAPGINYLQNQADNMMYLKLGEKLYELSLQLNQGKYSVEKLLIDKKEAEKDKFKYAPIFYLTE